MNIDNFDWGPTSEWFKIQATNEIFKVKEGQTFNDYQRIFQVEEDDIVVDIGASVGEFIYSILERKPKHCYVVEPLGIFFDTLKKNLYGHPVSFTNAAITSDKFLSIVWDGHCDKTNTLTFKEFIDQNRLFKIDFLKIDCEGGEYDVFNENNLEFLLKTPKIAIEMHLGSRIQKEMFRNFRDNILEKFSKYTFQSVDGVSIDWDLWNDHFIDYYREVMLYIDNR